MLPLVQRGQKNLPGAAGAEICCSSLFTIDVWWGVRGGVRPDTSAPTMLGTAVILCLVNKL